MRGVKVPLLPKIVNDLGPRQGHDKGPSENVFFKFVLLYSSHFEKKQKLKEGAFSHEMVCRAAVHWSKYPT